MMFMMPMPEMMSASAETSISTTVSTCGDPPRGIQNRRQIVDPVFGARRGAAIPESTSRCP